MKDHFTEFEGALYDDRDNLNLKPLRPIYSRHFSEIENLAQLKATLRAGAFVWPGGYPLYLILGDGEPATFDAVRANWREVVSSFAEHGAREWRVIGCEVHWEGEPLICAMSGASIESAYGNPDESESEGEQ